MGSKRVPARVSQDPPPPVETSTSKNAALGRNFVDPLYRVNYRVRDPTRSSTATGPLSPWSVASCPSLFLLALLMVYYITARTAQYFGVLMLQFGTCLVLNQVSDMGYISTISPWRLSLLLRVPQFVFCSLLELEALGCVGVDIPDAVRLQSFWVIQCKSILSTIINASEVSQ